MWRRNNFYNSEKMVSFFSFSDSFGSIISRTFHVLGILHVWEAGIKNRWYDF